MIDHHDMLHMTSHIRPSWFSACNIEKLGMGLGTRLQYGWFVMDGHILLCITVAWCQHAIKKTSYRMFEDKVAQLARILAV